MTDPDKLREHAASVFRQLRGQSRPQAAEDQPSSGPAGEDDAEGSSESTGNPEVGVPASSSEAESSEAPSREAPVASTPADGDVGAVANAGVNPTSLTGDPAPDTADSVVRQTNAPPPEPSSSEPAESVPAGPGGNGATGTTGSDPLETGRVGDAITFELSSDEMAALSPEEEEEFFPGRRPHPGAGRPLPRVMAIANQKGGVGKTTTAVNLGAALAELGYRVLVVDLDPQGNATTGLGINSANLDASVYDVILHDVPIEDCIEPSSLRNLFVVPATLDLAGAEIELVPAFSRELRLRRAVDSARDDFDFIFIDCPPSLGLLTVNGLAAANEVMVPIQCEYYALEGLGQLLRNVNRVRSHLNPQLEVSTIVLTMYDARTRLAEQVVDEVRSHFGDRVCRQIVPRTVRLSEAPSFRQPIVVFDSSSRGALAYRELAKEVSGGAPQRVG